MSAIALRIPVIFSRSISVLDVCVIVAVEDAALRGQSWKKKLSFRDSSSKSRLVTLPPIPVPDILLSASKLIPFSLAKRKIAGEKVSLMSCAESLFAAALMTLAGEEGAMPRLSCDDSDQIADL